MNQQGFSSRLAVLAVTLLLLGGRCVAATAQANEWTWLSGSSTVGTFHGQSGVYGTLGVASATNVPGGRSLATSWTDSSGNLWLFGGIGRDSAGNLGSLNDLWMFNPTTREWTWMGGSETMTFHGKPAYTYGSDGVYGTLGVASVANVPGGRSGALSWKDNSGKFWLFGGTGYDAAGLNGAPNDLWMFNPATREWTWMGGSDFMSDFPVEGHALYGALGVYGTLGVPSAGNSPGSHQGATRWVDGSGNFWLLGGTGLAASFNGKWGNLNDLWEFNPTGREWTWEGGSSAPGSAAPGVYGTLDVASQTNSPGSRSQGSTWTDSSGNLWLFGGVGFDSADNLGTLNDLWKFNPDSKEWTWMGGSKTLALVDGGLTEPGVYGTLGVASATNIPGGRAAASSWTDSSGNRWLFGGSGADSTGTQGSLNDLWEFAPTTGKWTWRGGNKTLIANQTSGFGRPGVYGTLGVTSATNAPGGRQGAATWTDSSGNLWLFGGQGNDSTTAVGYLNDLWEYKPR